MKNKLTSMGIVCLLVIGFLIGFINLGSEWAKGTSVSGTVYDGSGGPWTPAGSPYIVIGDVTVPAGETLTIEPGVEVKFDGYYNIYVYGTLTAIGTDINKITITSNMAGPSPGDWESIHICSKGNTEIKYCDISYSYRGIYIESSLNSITNNIIEFNSDYGIYLDSSAGNNIYNNQMNQCGIFIRGDKIEHWNTHDIDTSNTVNGKPVYYWKNQGGGTIPFGAGQVILANCSNIKIEKQDVSYSSAGITLGFSSKNYILGNTVSNNFNGIYLVHSNDNIITDNVAFNNGYGMQLWYSSNIQVTDNDIFTDSPRINQWGGGIHLFYSTIVSIKYNRISKSGEGIYIQNSDTITVKGNNISTNKGEGIRFWCSSNTVITYNDLWDNGIGIRMFQFSPNIIVHHNNIIDNDIQAIDWLSNQWDDSYPSGGNYWSDFDEPREGAFDDYHGPEQDKLGSDGIVDKGLAAGGGKNPYVIDADSQDIYPLMKPCSHNTETIGLSEGWNLISIPFIQSDTNIDTVLSPISGAYDAVQWYNGNDPSDHWKHYHSSKPPYMNDLNNIDHTMGFWIHITQPGGVIFDCPGTQPTEYQKITLYPGWNLVGYPSLCDRTRTEALNNINLTTDVDSIWTYNDITQKWEEMDASDDFEIGRGYWIHSLITKTWEVPI